MHYNTAKANSPQQKDVRKPLRRNMTPAEAALWRALRGRGAGGWKFRRQQGIGPYVLDFYCPELRLCVELDGNSHDHRFEYDEQRTAFLVEQGIRVVRFRNEQVWASVEGIAAEIVRIGTEILGEFGGDDSNAGAIDSEATDLEITDPTPSPSP